jgi:hypothetical protein
VPSATGFFKRGMDTEQVVARFSAERQALALMDHPAMAKVFEAGSTPQGRPYFVMEHVRGVPITEHCDRHKLGTHVTWAARRHDDARTRQGRRFRFDNWQPSPFLTGLRRTRARRPFVAFRRAGLTSAQHRRWAGGPVARWRRRPGPK